MSEPQEAQKLLPAKVENPNIRRLVNEVDVIITEVLEEQEKTIQDRLQADQVPGIQTFEWVYDTGDK